MATKMPLHSNQLPVIKIESFEGPYDLLLELAQNRKIDLTTISLKNITDDFLAYLRTHAIPPLLQADFLVVAATLLLLKLRQVLPELTAQEEEEITSLTERLRIYQLYRQQAALLRQRWDSTPLLPGPEKLAVEHEVPYPTVTLNDITRHMHAAIAQIKAPLDKHRHLRARTRSLKECMQLITERVHRLKELIFADAALTENRQTAAVSFLAILELARQQRITLIQDQPFDTIIIRPANP